MDFSKKLDELLEANNIKSLRQLATELEIPYTTLWDYYSNPARLEKANLAYIKKIAQRLNCSVDYLAYEDIKNLNFDNGVPIKINNEVETILIPVLGVIKAGTPIEAQESILDYIEIPKDWTKGGKQFYGLKIGGNSMSPKYMPNDIVVFEQTNDFEYANNRDACIMVNGDDATFKKFNINHDGVTLTPLNLDNEDGYLPTFYNVEQIQNLPVKVIGIAKRRISDID